MWGPTVSTLRGRKRSPNCARGYLWITVTSLRRSAGCLSGLDGSPGSCPAWHEPLIRVWVTAPTCQRGAKGHALIRLSKVVNNFDELLIVVNQHESPWFRAALVPLWCIKDYWTLKQGVEKWPLCWLALKARRSLRNFIDAFLGNIIAEHKQKRLKVVFALKCFLLTRRSALVDLGRYRQAAFCFQRGGEYCIISIS